MEISRATRITAGALTGVTAALTLFNSAAAGATPANNQPASPATASVQQVQNQAPRISAGNFNSGSAINTVPALLDGKLTPHFAQTSVHFENGMEITEAIKVNNSMHPTWTKWSITFGPHGEGESAWAWYDGLPPPNAEDWLPHYNPGTGHIDRMGDGPGVLGHN